MKVTFCEGGFLKSLVLCDVNVEHAPRVSDLVNIGGAIYTVNAVCWHYPFAHTAEALVYVSPAL